jgi:hypothetical protein
MPISISRGISLNSSGSYSVLKEIIFSERSTFNNSVAFNSSGTFNNVNTFNSSGTFNGVNTFNGDVKFTKTISIPLSSGTSITNGSIWLT